MAARLVNHVIEVEACKDRDWDRQSANLQKIKGFVDLSFTRGWWGDPDYFTVTFQAEGFNLRQTMESCERAVAKARKVKSNRDSKIAHDEARQWFKRLDDNAPKTMRIYIAQQ